VIDDKLTAQLLGVVTIGVGVAIQVSVLMYGWKVLPVERRVSFVFVSCLLIAPIFWFGVRTFRRAGKLDS
jgi:hypothetical protein